jgi:hypothetical protein
MREFIKEEFTEDELILLKMAFKMLEAAIEEERHLFYSGDYRNEVFNLKEKLGIYDLVEG